MILNYDHCLRFQVVDKRISYIDDGTAEVVADNHGNICIHIEFDEQWDGCGKIARFIYNGQWKDVVLDADGDCICPNEVIKKGRFSLGVYGAELKTSTPIVVTVVPSILSESGEELPEDPTPGIYDQILTQYAVAIEAADNAATAAMDAAGEVGAAVEALNTAKQELEDGGFIFSIKELNKGEKFFIWIGTEEEYKVVKNSLPKNTFCITTDHTNYGLGEAALSNWDDVDTLTKTGWHRFSSDIEVGGVSCNYAYMRVDSYNDTNATQTLFLICDGKRYVLVRHMISSVWESEWAWENPACKSGKVYKTTEMRNGNPVYMFFAETSTNESFQSWSVRDMIGYGIMMPRICSLECVYVDGISGLCKNLDSVSFNEATMTIDANFGNAINKATVTMKFY